ncbi:diaminopimelate epimerase [Paenibacillus xylanilyticus]|uniref:diaminopimelate epimerase n=1 Tax=Paenibacillus TaxID=44249 RepID=UPI001F316BCF|nr:diaminopimelate epimerase [Paenibacillus xylanilyticus]
MKQEIEFIKFNPTQNMTVLVKTSHPAEEYQHIASSIMSYDHVYAEQVGFIVPTLQRGAAARLQMAGGEFCGNACMALAAYLASEQELGSRDYTELLLEVSGTEQLITCQVRKQLNEYFCQVNMPIPRQIERQTITYEGFDQDMIIVRYEEFIHIVVEVDGFDDGIRTRAQNLARLLGLTLGDKLIGILLFNPLSEELAPLIYVPGLDSLIWERGCGSGTASLGAYLAWKTGREITALIKQPGGSINVVARFDEHGLGSIHIEGSVGIVAQGTAFIDVQQMDMNKGETHEYGRGFYQTVE